MHAHAERFNRAFQEEFVGYNEVLLFTDLVAFNDRLPDYLLRFNGEHPTTTLINPFQSRV